MAHLPAARRLRLPAALLAAALALCRPIPAPAAEIHLAPFGSDELGDGSRERPWRSLSHACDRARSPGDTVVLAAGDYAETRTCRLAPGVALQGAGRDRTRIRAQADPAVEAVSPCPPAAGGNRISGIAFIGRGAGIGIASVCRHDQRISANHFEDFDAAVELSGAPPLWKAVCRGEEAAPRTYCDNNELWSRGPAENDWATGVAVEANTLRNATLRLHTIRGAQIRDNVIDNSAAPKSGVGHTAVWWSGVHFLRNRIRMAAVGWRCIALEVWMVENNCRFEENVTNGWFSIIKNPHGPRTPYSWQIVGNRFESDLPPGDVRVALETGYYVENVLVAENYFANAESGGPYSYAVGIWGLGAVRGVTLRNNCFYNLNQEAILINSSDVSKRNLFQGRDIRILNNVFDRMGGGRRPGVTIDDGAGTVEGVLIANNIFIQVQTGALIRPSGHDVANVDFRHNLLTRADAMIRDQGRGGFLPDRPGNLVMEPQLLRAGERPYPYYAPAGAHANTVDRGVEVGLPFFGPAPDLGAFEYGMEPGRLAAPRPVKSPRRPHAASARACAGGRRRGSRNR